MVSKISGNKYMLVLEDRIFYLGLLGRRMKNRRLGAVSIYLAPEGSIRLRRAGGAWVTQDLAVVAPYEAHQLCADCGIVISVLIEPERLAAGELARLLRDYRCPELRAGQVARLRGASRRLMANAAGEEMAAEAFDRIVLGRALAEKAMDPRIAGLLEDVISDGCDGPSLASDLADFIGLSSSRFLHLFKEQTGVSFRNYRMWKRARSFLPHANHSSSLTDVALSLGYPDSSHFSHSIRKTFGLQPRSIRIGSQDLRIEASARMAAGA